MWSLARGCAARARVLTHKMQIKPLAKAARGLKGPHFQTHGLGNSAFPVSPPGKHTLLSRVE